MSVSCKNFGNMFTIKSAVCATRAGNFKHNVEQIIPFFMSPQTKFVGYTGLTLSVRPPVWPSIRVSQNLVWA